MGRRSTVLGSVLILAAVVFVLSGALPSTVNGASSAARFAAPLSDIPSPANAPQPSGGQPAAPLAGPERLVTGQHPGAYYIDYGSTVMSPSVYPVEGAIRFYGWSTLQPAANNYDWPGLQAWLQQRTASGLSTGIMLTTYDGPYDGDIKSTPDFVIATPGATVVTTNYIDYMRKQWNGAFEWSPHTNNWA